MNNYEKVFIAIKKHCDKQKTLAEISCFDLVAKDGGVPLSKLHIYLAHLQEIGLIEYSMEDNYMYLTRTGKEQTTLAS